MKTEARFRRLAQMCQHSVKSAKLPAQTLSNEGLHKSAIVRREMRDAIEHARVLAMVTAPENATPSDAAFLEAIVHREFRPAVLVQDGQPLAWPSEWYHLNGYAEPIARAIASTGRIETEGDTDLTWIGTGFVVDDGLVITNRHVLEEIASYDTRFGWRFHDGVSARIDFAEEVGGIKSHEVPIIGIWGVHSHYDIAVLRIGPGHPPALLYSPNSARDGQTVVTVGYPAYDSRRNDATVMNEVFRGIYNVKRIMPGFLIDEADDPHLVRHDCSTLGGSSGSPVIDPTSGNVVGVHYKGYYLRWNEAVDLTPPKAQ